MAGGRSFFTSISSVSIVELPSGGWTLFYDQDIARCPHLLVIITITDIVINISIVAILCTVRCSTLTPARTTIQFNPYTYSTVGLCPSKTCYWNILESVFFFSLFVDLFPGSLLATGLVALFTCLGLCWPGGSCGGTHQWND